MVLMRQAGIYPQVRINDIVDGDSIAEGAWGSYMQSFPRLMSNYISRPANVYDVAISGQTTALNLATVVNWSNLCQLPGGNVFYHTQIGTNDIGTGVSAATIETNLAKLMNQSGAAGCANKFVQTILPRTLFVNTPAYETIRLAVNAWELANASTLNAAIIDMATDPSMGNAANLTNVLYYQDGTHPGYAYVAPNAAQGGYPFMATGHATAVNGLLH